ncbi:MAG: hypothetical protein QGG58_00570 [Chloroflexota bacterium]|nr:hypothetical protein [Chloroflexota bacterium]
MAIRIGGGPGAAIPIIPPERDDEPNEIDRGGQAEVPPPADDGGEQAARVNISNEARELAAAPAEPAAPAPDAAPAAPPEPVQAAEPAEPPPPPPEEEEPGAGLDLIA